MGEGEALAYEGVEEGGVALAVVEGSDIFTAEAFNYEYHNVASGGIDLQRVGVDGLMEWAIDGIQLGGSEIGRVGEGGFAECADEGEGGVEHDGRFGWAVDILVGVADGDGADGGGGAAAHTDDGQGDIGEEANQVEPAESLFGMVGVGEG